MIIKKNNNSFFCLMLMLFFIFFITSCKLDFLNLYLPKNEIKNQNTNSQNNQNKVSIPSVDITGIILQDGSVEIIERRTIRFDGDFTYGFYELPKKGTEQLSDFSIADGDKLLTFDESKTKETGTYYREDLGDTWKYYYYFQASNTTKIFTYHYFMKKVIDLYEDYGQFYYQLQGTGWDFEIGSFTGAIKWNMPISKDNYRIWAHGPLWGNFIKLDEYSTKLEIETVPPKTMVEVRVLLPKNYFTIKPNRTGNILETVINEEIKWANEANQKRNP